LGAEEPYEHDFIPAEPVSDHPVPGVRIANVGWQTRRRQEQRAHDRLAAIEQPTRTGWAFREADEIASLETFLALRVPQGGRAGQDQQPLLPPVDVVIGLGPRFGINLHHRRIGRSAPSSGPNFASPSRASAFTAGCGGDTSGSRTISTDSDGPAVPSPCQ
jgi:hypothetical protein